jgi:hypothetical protein
MGFSSVVEIAQPIHHQVEITVGKPFTDANDVACVGENCNRQRFVTRLVEILLVEGHALFHGDGRVSLPEDRQHRTADLGQEIGWIDLHHRPHLRLCFFPRLRRQATKQGENVVQMQELRPAFVFDGCQNLDDLALTRRRDRLASRRTPAPSFHSMPRCPIALTRID